MSRRCDYYILCDAQIQESLSEGERGGGGLTAEKQPQQHYFQFLTLNRFYSFTGGSSIFQGGGGSNFFQGGGGGGGGEGGPDAYFHKNAYNL